MTGLGRNSTQVGFYSEANGEPVKALKEERWKMHFGFCSDDSDYTVDHGAEGNKTGEKEIQ